MDILASYDEAAVMETGNRARYAMDDRLVVTFYMKAVKNTFKSNEAGRPIFDEREFIRVIVPGDSRSVFEDLVTDEHRTRFADRYARFKRGVAQASTGTPLEVWPQMTVGLVAEMKAMNITTVEELAGLSDGNAQKIMGNFDLRRRAQAFLDAAAGDAANSKLAAELEKRDSEIAALKSQMEQLILMTSGAGPENKKGK
jgi:hypothetical protein